MGFILIISWVFLGSQPCVNAAVPFVQGKSLEDVLTKVPETYENVNYLYSEESPDDYLGYFTSDRATWQPRIKYTGESDAIDEYFFCLTFHLLAPDGSITYTKGDTESIPEAYYDYAYIIENGFGYRTYDAEEGYDDLLWDYYVTSLAIWQYQYESDLMGDAASSFVSIRDFETDDETTKEAIIDLVDRAKANEDRTKLAIPFNASDESYQDIISYKIYKIAHSSSIPSPSPAPIPTPSTGTPTCEIKGGKYYDDKGNEVSKSKYEEACDKIEPKISISYIDNCTDNFVQKAAMKLVNGSSCSGKTIKSWTSGKLTTFENIAAGTYTICDTTNDYHKTITVKNIGTLQKFEMLTNDPCEEPHQNEPNSDTGVTSYLVLSGVLGLGTILYLVLRKKGIFVKIK